MSPDEGGLSLAPEQALRESEERFSLLAENIPGVIYLCRNNERYSMLYLNDAVEELTGYTREEFLSDRISFVQLYHPEDAAGIFSLVDAALAQGEPFHLVYRIRHRSGEWRWLEEVGAGVFRDGALAYLEGFIRDVTAGRLAEQAVEASERRYRRLFEESPVALWEEDLSAVGARLEELRGAGVGDFEAFFGDHPQEVDECIRRVRVTGVNRAAVALYGARDAADFVAGLERILGQENRQLFKRELTAIASGASFVATDGAVRMLDGERRVVSRRLTVAAGREEALAGVLVSTSDITERVRAEEERRARARMEAFAEHVGFAIAQGGSLQEGLQRCAEGMVRHLGAALARIWTLNARGDVLEMQASAGLETRLDGEYACIPVGRYRVGQVALERRPHLTNSVSSDHLMHDKEWARREGVIAFAGHPLLVEERLVGVVAMFSRQALTDAAIQALALVADRIALGVERKRAEEERQRLESQMRHAQKLESLGVLAGGIAHDFNNLLVGILGNTGMALMDLAPDAPARPLLEEVEKAALRAAELSRQMLAYSGRGRFQVQVFQLNSLVEEMTNLLVASISKKARLEFDFARGLPPVEGDPTQVRQVVMNLITNASDALGDQSGMIRICTGAMAADRGYLLGLFPDAGLAEGKYVFLEVADSGCGMDAETRARVFDPFFTTKFQGRGLGMAAVLGIVRGHKGAIKIDSAPGQGTTFRVLLPASAKPAASLEVRAQARAPWRGAGTILVVDDEATVRFLAEQSLKRAGFDVLLAEDGQRAVDLFRARAAGIRGILLDMTMPLLGGDETFRELRRIRPDVPIILSSGYDEQDATSRFTGKGLAGFIQKPYGARDLAEKVREILGI